MARYPTIKDWPEEDRPREKLLQKGAALLSPTELLAIILRTGNASTGESAVDQARLLLDKFENLKGIDAAPLQELKAIKGVGPAKMAQLKACFELARRLGQDKWKVGEPLRSSEDVFRHFRKDFESEKREIFYVVLLTNKNRKIREVKISEGSLTASLVHPREVYNPVIRESAAAVIFVHNHPSGDPAPSPEDLEITRRLKEVGEVMGVRVLDHVVIGRERYFSFSDRGIL
ncbi:MAG: DNA repair protein RadC [Deltaproteobacteria bacterium]|nr:DNA repair protein RadC [Deltaproteobacteria bacterium]MBI2347494.1 DNA repair protein RadC [Deltaproteobacteria bacterium]MBI2539220.1 DNA repair protein RadC [Deltaproteobacteria bacterium]MBI3060836.1 DNA repair protein RadC [Deltaproteobacteria bacterium]